MGKRSRQFEDEKFVSCDVCDGDIAIDFYFDTGDLVCCEECDSEYVIKSRDPIMLSLIVDDYYDESDDDDYYDERLSRDYD